MMFLNVLLRGKLLKFGLLIATNHKNLVAAIWPDVPGGNRARDANNDGAKNGGTQARNGKVIEHRCNEPEHSRIDHKQEQPKRHYGDGQCQQKCDGSDEGIDEAKQDSGDDETAGAHDLHTWNQH